MRQPGGVAERRPVFLFGKGCAMANTGWKPGTVATQDGTGPAWANVANALTVGDGSYATVNTPSGDGGAGTPTSRFLVVSAPDMSSVPSGAIVTGVETRVVHKSTTPLGQSVTVWLRKNGTTNVGASASATAYSATSDTTSTLGSPSSLWSTTFTDSEVKAGGFSAAVSVTNLDPDSGATISVGSVEFNVTYTLPPAPVVTANSAAAVHGVGGTVQMSATNSPTSWSLTGSPPTGVSINSSGLVTWTGATPVGVHSIGVRATNATGNGDGTLTLTITAAAASATGPTKSQIGGAIWKMAGGR